MLGVVALGMTVHCGAPAQQNHTHRAVAVGPAPSQISHPPQPDLSEVERPAGVIAQVRIAPLTPLIERVGSLTGAGDPAREVLREALRVMSGDECIAALADHNAPAELIWFARPARESDPDPDVMKVFAFGAPAFEQIESRLSNTHRLVMTMNGYYRVERTEARQDTQGACGSQENDGYAPYRRHCVLAPTPRSSETRIVCADDADVLPFTVPYIARTLSRREVPLNTITLDVVPDALRRVYGDRLLDEIELMRRGLSTLVERATSGPWHDPPVRESIGRMLSEVIDNMRSVVNESAMLESSLTFAEDRAIWHSVLGLRQPSGTLVRAFAEAMRNQPAPPREHFDHLPADAALYFASSVDERPFRAQIAQLTEIANHVMQADRSLAPADRAALRQALDALTVLDQASIVGGVGYDDEGEAWGAGQLRVTTRPAADVVAAVRMALSTLQRPNVTRLFNASVRQLAAWGLSRMPSTLDARAIRQVPAEGLPRGSLVFEMPSLASISSAAWQPQRSYGSLPTPPARGRGRGRTPTRATRPSVRVTQYVLVPSGQDLVFAFGRDARALFARAQGASRPGIDPAVLQAQGATLSVTLVPAGLPNMLRRSSPSLASQAASLFARMQDGGRTPITIRVGTDETEGLTRFTADVEVRAQTLSLIGMFAQLFGP